MTNYPTIEITNLGSGKWRASAAIDSSINVSHLRDAESVSSIAQGEFMDFEGELRAQLDEQERVRDRNIRVTAASFRNEQDDEAVVHSTLIIEFTKCDATDPQCNDVVGLIVKDAVAELREALARDLAQYVQR
ncbi:hypothetical protein [Mycolicibacterium sp. XJ879]